MKKVLLVACLLVAVTLMALVPLGTPWNKNVQTLPGRVECEFYDLGGEGISYHDSDSINNGSGKLNPANGNFLNEFRMKEGVDISFTKSKGIDDNPFNKVEPVLNQLYVGWTQPGEWVNYTVNVVESGVYRVSLMYTANGDGAIAFDIDGQTQTGSLKIPTVYDSRDTVAWRQWHHWSRLESLAKIKMKKGLHVLTLRVVEHGNMNFDFLEFKKEQ